MAKDQVPKQIAIACQGGGSHAAFSAGVLERLLCENQTYFEVKALSGTSGGAVCAFLTWYALLNKDNEQAAQLLESFWKEDNSARSLEELFVNEALVWSNWWAETTVGVPVINPYRAPYYSLPPFHSPDYWQDRLEDTLEGKLGEKIEDRVELSDSPVMLFVGGVNALTGEFRVFKSHKPDDEDEDRFVFNDSPYDGISAEAVVASAAVPLLFKAVHTGIAAYWNDSQEPPARIAEGIYWDGLYSQNPPIRDLPNTNPDEIWVVQINPEEIEEEPKTTARIWDRRNELAGNISLNQELYFVRQTNEHTRQVKELVRRLEDLGGAVEEPPKAKGKLIKVRRIELSMQLGTSSKLDRNAAFIEQLINHGREQAEHFLKAIPFQFSFEKRWDHALQVVRRGKNVDDALQSVTELFTEDATIEVMLPDRPRAPTASWRELGAPRDPLECLKWCLRRNFNIEQTRDYYVEGKRITFWMLATADYLLSPRKSQSVMVKGRAEAIVDKGKIARFVFWPLNSEAIEELLQS